MWAVPLVYYGFFAALVVEEKKFNKLLTDYTLDKTDVAKAKLAQYEFDLIIKLFKPFGYWTSSTNLISCIIMLIAFRFVHKIGKEHSNSLSLLEDRGLQHNVKINTTVVYAHIAGTLLILGYTVATLLSDDIYNTDSNTYVPFYRAGTA